MFWSTLLWAFLALAEGRYPTEDWEGEIFADCVEADRASKHFAGGMLFVTWMVRGDLDFFANSLGLENSNNAGGMCVWCKANKCELPLEEWAVAFGHVSAPWNDISPDAMWRRTIWSSHDDWLSWHGGDTQVNPIFMIPGVSVFTIVPDCMHIVDLGVTKAVLGNVLYEVCYTPGHSDGVDAESRLHDLWSFIVRQYRAKGSSSQLHTLTLNMFTDTSAPHSTLPLLSGLTKAAIARHLMPILADFWRERHRPAYFGDMQILNMLNALESFYDAFDVSEYLLPAERVATLQRSTDEFLQYYRWLHVHSGTHRWQELPKFHGMQHISLHACYQNPRWGWVYLDEDWMGLIKDICQSCMNGTASHKVVPKLLKKWTYGFFGRVLRQEEH